MAERAEEALVDLAGRLREKVTVLNDMADALALGVDRFRLRGKAEGVALALSFVEEAIREQDHQHQEWIRRNFLGSASAISEAKPNEQTWNGPVFYDPKVTSHER